MRDGARNERDKCSASGTAPFRTSNFGFLSDFEFRISGFRSDSGFGFRVSDFVFTFATYAAYASTVTRQKNPLNTSFRSATHATDSTRSGCTPNIKATKKAGPVAPVSLVSKRNISAVLSP